jgi:hypothetical protein
VRRHRHRPGRLEEAARRRLDALPLAAAVAERIVEMSAEELRELEQRLQERRAAEA